MASRRKYGPHYSVNKVFQCIDSPQRSPQERRGKAAYSLLCAPAATSAVEPKIDNLVNAVLMKAERIFLFRNLNRSSGRASILYSAPPRSATRQAGLRVWNLVSTITSHSTSFRWAGMVKVIQPSTSPRSAVDNEDLQNARTAGLLALF